LNRLLAAALVVVAGIAVEIAIPGWPAYHSGWYNVALCALVVVVILTGRAALKKARGVRGRLAVAAVIFGAAATGLAGVANGLFAPDDREVVGAPGERVRVEELGELVFPLTAYGAAAPVKVTLERPLHAPAEIGSRRHNTGNFILRTVPRSVVSVEVRDLHGDQLTVTQPNGTVFLSPVLLMAHRQTIAGLDLPFDSFNVPAARRVVKAILFTPAQAAVMLHDTAALGQPAVLFAVDDENDRPLPRGIALSAGSRPLRVDGLWLRANVTSYPEVEVVSTPNIAVVALGTMLAVGGLIALLADRPR
jgi:hypothetical protein